MKALSRFVAKFTSLIVGVLSCFERVIFKGYLPLTNGPALEGFVDHVLRIRRKDFMAFAEGQAETLIDFAKRLAHEAAAEYHYLLSGAKTPRTPSTERENQEQKPEAPEDKSESPNLGTHAIVESHVPGFALAAPVDAQLAAPPVLH